jgi:hypothetical protein
MCGMKERKTEPGVSISVTVRLPGELVEWLRLDGLKSCRTFSGEVLLGLLRFRDQVVFEECCQGGVSDDLVQVRGR